MHQSVALGAFQGNQTIGIDCGKSHHYQDQKAEIGINGLRDWYLMMRVGRYRVERYRDLDGAIRWHHIDAEEEAKHNAEAQRTFADAEVDNADERLFSAYSQEHHLAKCMLWVASRKHPRSSPNFEQHIWDNAKDEPFMQGVSREGHAAAFRPSVILT